jgi:CheY-like chemotaxis protein
MIKTKNIGEPMTILLVEDNEDHAELICRSFEEHHVLNNLKLVHDGAEALDYLFRRDQYKDSATSPQPHVILLDLRLPKIDGLEVLRQIKGSELLRNIPVVVLTSSETEGDINKAYAQHVNSYLTKPVDFDKFTKLLKDLGFYWLAWNQPSTSPE